MLKLKLNESTNLAFEMIVEGSATKVDMTWLVLETANGYEIRLPATHSGNEVQCSVPALQGVLPNGKTKVHLEVIIDGRFYRPITEEVDVSHYYNDIKITAKTTADVSQVPRQTEVTLESPKAEIANVPLAESTGKLRVNMSQMGKWKVDQDNVKYYDRIVKSKGKIASLDTRPYEELLNDFGIFYTKVHNEAKQASKSQPTESFAPQTGSVTDQAGFDAILDDKIQEYTAESEARTREAKEIARRFVESIVPKSPAAEKQELNKLQGLLRSKH